MKTNTPGDHALRQAERAAKRGDLAEAERWTKVAAQNQKQWEQLRTRELEPEMEDPDEIRAEVLRRLARIRACSDWESERDLYIDAVKRAEETGAPAPPPLRPYPAGDEA